MQPRLKNLIRVVIYDMDGVITDSIEGWFEALKKVFLEEFDRNPSREDFNRVHHNTTDLVIKKLLDNQTDIHISDKRIEELGHRVDQIFADEMLPFVKATRNAPKVIQTLDKYYIQGIVTNGPTQVAHKAMKQLNIFDCFDFIIGCDGCKPKPDPQLLLEALDLVQEKSKHCVYIGDSYSDYLASKQADILFIYRKNRDIPEMQDFNGFQINHLDELYPLLL